MKFKIEKFNLYLNLFEKKFNFFKGENIALLINMEWRLKLSHHEISVNLALMEPLSHASIEIGGKTQMVSRRSINKYICVSIPQNEDIFLKTFKCLQDANNIAIFDPEKSLTKNLWNFVHKNKNPNIIR